MMSEAAVIQQWQQVAGRAVECGCELRIGKGGDTTLPPPLRMARFELREKLPPGINRPAAFFQAETLQEVNDWLAGWQAAKRHH